MKDFIRPLLDLNGDGELTFDDVLTAIDEIEDGMEHARSHGVRTAVPGSVIYVQRKLIKHYGIFEGNDKVIHLSYTLKPIVLPAIVHESTVDDFLEGDPGFQVVDFSAVQWAYSDEETLKRARSRLGEIGYELFTDNCEHFALWCKLGEMRSRQVDDPIHSLPISDQRKYEEPEKDE